MKTLKITLLLLSLTNLLVLSGCATSGTNKLSQGSELTMSEIYNMKASGEGSTDDSDLSQVRTGLTNISGSTNQIIVNESPYERSSSINRQFKQLSNPQIGMYVFPHIVEADGDQEPVPGYTTAFFMYKKNNFALPSEKY